MPKQDGRKVDLARWLASGFGSGYAPKAPGTAGSLASLPVAWLLLHWGGWAGLGMAWLALLLLACWSTWRLLPRLHDKDPSWVVIDEWLGQWLTLLLATPLSGAGFTAFALAFAAFRLFDIVKPGPVGMAERLGPAWWSIHADDLAAGALGGALVAGVTALIAWWRSGF